MYWTPAITFNSALIGVVCEGSPISWFGSHWLTFHGGFEATTDKLIHTYTISYHPDAHQWTATNATVNIICMCT